MLDQANPYDQFDEQPVAPTATPRLPAQGPGPGHVAVAPQADSQTPPQSFLQPAPQPVNPYDQFEVPAQSQNQPGDHSLTTDDEMEGGFADSHPATPKSKLSPEDEAQYRGMLHTADASTLQRFLVSKGYAADPSQLELFVKQREQAKTKGGRVNYGVSYDFPRPVLQHDPGTHGQDAQDALVAPVHGFLENIPGFDHAAALGRAIDNKVTGRAGDRTFGQEYNYQDDLQHGQVANEEESHPYLRVSGELLGGLAIPAGLEGVGLKAGTDVLKAGGSMADARAAVKVAVRNRMSAGGAIYGAAHGAGKADTPGEAITGALIEGALGAATGGAMGQLGRAGKSAAAGVPALTGAQEVLQAADRQGITPFAPDLGGATTRRAAAAMVQTPLGASPLVNAAKQTVGDAHAARDRIAAVVGQALQPEAAGEQARSGALSYINSSGAEARGIYKQAESASQGVGLKAPKALAALDQNIAELKDTIGGAPGLSVLQNIRDQIAAKAKPVATGVLDSAGQPIMRDAGGQITVAGLRGMRTQLRDQFIKEGLRGSDLERRVNQVTDAASQDINDGLVAAGKPEAATLFTRADNAWRDRVNTIDTVIKPLIGTRENPKSGEQVIKTLTADLQGNNARAVRFLRTLPPEEQANTRASIIGALGRQSAGAQNADGDGFSMAQFLTHWNRIGETAKAAYFGPEARAALNDLARVAQGSKEAAAFANKSNSGGAVNGVLSGLLATPTAGLSLAAPWGMGRLLASPRFARWLARAPKTGLSTPAYLDRLTRIARAEPAIANQVLELQQRLADVFTSSPTRLAAQPAPDGVLQTQGNAGDQEPQNESLQP